MKFVLATQNPKKLKEMSAILGELGVEVVSEADLGVKIEVEETGETFAENSLLKAKAVIEATKLPAIADDSGLCVDALNGGPGVYSARFGGEGLDDIGRYRLLLQMMHGQADRRAHFHTTITCAFPNGDILQNDGEVEGTIAFAPMGENGFGYDPVFFVPDKRKTFATAHGGRESGDLAPRQGTAGVQGNAQELSCGTSIKKDKDKEILWN